MAIDIQELLKMFSSGGKLQTSPQLTASPAQMGFTQPTQGGLTTPTPSFSLLGGQNVQGQPDLMGGVKDIKGKGGGMQYGDIVLGLMSGLQSIAPLLAGNKTPPPGARSTTGRGAMFNVQPYGMQGDFRSMLAQLLGGDNGRQ